MSSRISGTLAINNFSSVTRCGTVRTRVKMTAATNINKTTATDNPRDKPFLLKKQTIGCKIKAIAKAMIKGVIILITKRKIVAR